jgi:ankyrin repeat protein
MGKEESRVWSWARGVAEWCAVVGAVVMVVGGALAFHQYTASMRNNGRWELYDAAQRGDVGRVGQLLDSGQDVDAPDDIGRTALTAAARSGRADVVRLLLSRGADVERAELGGWTPLMLAVLQGHPEVAEVLLGHGADVRAWAWDGADVLLAAVIGGDARCVRIVLGAGADPNASGRKNHLLDYLDESQGEIARLLLKAGLLDAERYKSVAMR